MILDAPAGEVAVHVRDGSSRRTDRGAAGWFWGPGPGGLAADLGRFDVDIEVVGPAELRDAFARLARRYAAAASEAP